MRVSCSSNWNVITVYRLGCTISTEQLLFHTEQMEDHVNVPRKVWKSHQMFLKWPLCMVSFLSWTQSKLDSYEIKTLLVMHVRKNLYYSSLDSLKHKTALLWREHQWKLLLIVFHMLCPELNKQHTPWLRSHSPCDLVWWQKTTQTGVAVFGV